MSSASLPPGYSPPAAVVTSTDHGGWITITAALGLPFVLFFLVVRVYIRMGISPPFRYDDAVLGIATVMSVLQAVVAFLQVSKGFGKSIGLLSPSAIVDVQKIAYASDILYLLALFLSKASVVLLIIRLTPKKPQIRLLQGLLAFSTLWVVISIFVVALRCDLAHPWIQYNVKCPGLSARWEFVGALDIIIEICLFAASIILVFGLRMALKPKLTVIIVFAFRLQLIAIAILRLHYINIEIFSTNSTFDGAPAAVLTQLELYYSLISATIPCLNRFLRAVSTNYGAIGPETIIGGSLGYGSDKVNSYSLTPIGSTANTKKQTKRREKATKTPKKSQPDTMQRERPAADPQIYRGDHTRSIARETSEGDLDAASIGSNDSTKMIIKEMHWFVDTDSGKKTPS